MNFTWSVTILIIFDLCMVTIECAKSGDDRNYSQTPRPHLANMKMYMKSGKDNRVRSIQDEVSNKRGRSLEESSSARRSHTRMARIEHNPEDKTRSKLKRPPTKWTNEQCNSLLRLAYAHYDSTGQNGVGAFDWKKIVIIWHGHWDPKVRDVLKIQTNNLHTKMLKAVEKFDNAGIKWPRQLDDDLLKIYFATDSGDKSGHAKRIHDAWLEKHPDFYRLTPAYLLKRAETMLLRVMKFSLDNPQEILRRRHSVDWKPEHDELLRFLWNIYPHSTKNEKQCIFNEAVKQYPVMQHLGEDRVSRRAEWLNSQPVVNNESTHFRGEYAPDRTHVEYHLFMDDQNFPSLELRTYGHHVRMPGTSSQLQPTISRLGPDLDLNISHSERQSPDTNLYLGYRYHE